MKTSLTKVALTMLLFPVFSIALVAQSTGEKKITITKRTVDKDGSEITETIVKKGKAAENFKPEQYIKENKSANTDVDIRIEDGDNDVSYYDYENDDSKSRTFTFNAWDNDSWGKGFSWNSCDGGEKHGFLGVEEDSDEDSDRDGLVVQVVRNSAAAKAGLKTNDVILKLNDTKTNDWDDLSDFMAKTKPGDKINITYSRGGKTATAEATLTKHSDITKFNCENKHERGFLGVNDDGDDDKDEPGVRVDISRSSAAEKAGLEDGDVILKLDDVEVLDWEDLSDFMDATEKGQKIKVTYERDGKRNTAEATLGDQNQNWKVGNIDIINREKEACLGVYTEAHGEGEKQGAIIDDFTRESAARDASMSTGDVILSVNGNRVKGHNDLWEELAKYKPADKVTVAYLSAQGERKTVEATLKACQDKSSAVSVSNDWDDDCDDDDAMLGVFVNESTTSTVTINGRRIRSNDRAAEGFAIGSVIEGSAAEAAGLQEGDILLSVGGKTTNSFGDLARAMDTFKPGDKVKVEYLRGGEKAEAEATLKSCSETNQNKSRKFFTWNWNNEDNERFRERRIITIRKGEEGDAPKVNTPPANQPATDRNLKLDAFKAYPNPTQGQVTVEFRGEAVPTVVTLFDLAGRQLFREELNGFDGTYNQQFDLAAYAKGTIVVQVAQGDKVFTEQIVVN